MLLGDRDISPVTTKQMEMKMINWIGSFIHNCIAHPLMCFLPKKWGDSLHDWTIRAFWRPKKNPK